MSDSQPTSQSSLNDSEFMTEIRAAEVGELFRHGIPGIIGALTGSIILTVGLWPSVPHDRLLLWLGAFLVSLIPRIAMGIRFWKIKPSGPQAEPWARLFAVGTFIGALFWASVPVFLFPDENFLRQSLVTFGPGRPLRRDRRCECCEAGKSDSLHFDRSLRTRGPTGIRGWP